MQDLIKVTGEISVSLYEVSALNNHHNGWRKLPDMHKLEFLDGFTPVESHTSTNVACTGLFEWISESLNAAITTPDEPDQIALGRSSTTPSSSDTSLDDEVDRVDITSFADEGTQVRMTAFVGEAEANVDVSAGETISEGGVYAGSKLLNHSLFGTDYEKDNTKTMTVEIVLSFSAP